MRYTNSILLIMIFLLMNIAVSAQDEFFEPKTTVGGYGELHYNLVKPDVGETSRTLDFHRFVLFVGHSFSEKWSFKSEVELEHNIVESGQGALELEQAYIDYHYADYFGVQAGVILPSAGLINEYHEPPTFLGVERPEYARVIIPTTWFGNGAAVYGNIQGLDYKVVVMEGLDPKGFSASSGIRGGRQEGFESNADNFLYNARVDYVGFPGLRAGLSYSYNKAGKETDTTNNIGLFELHAAYQNYNLVAVVEYGNISFSEGNVKTANGWYADLGFNIGSLLKIPTQIIPFVRISGINTAAETITGGTSEQENSNKQWMIGVNIKPLSQIVVKADYSIRTKELGSVETKLFNLGIGYMF